MTSSPGVLAVSNPFDTAFLVVSLYSNLLPFTYPTPEDIDTDWEVEFNDSDTTVNGLTT